MQVSLCCGRTRSRRVNSSNGLARMSRDFCKASCSTKRNLKITVEGFDEDKVQKGFENGIMQRQKKHKNRKSSEKKNLKNTERKCADPYR